MSGFAAGIKMKSRRSLTRRSAASEQDSITTCTARPWFSTTVPITEASFSHAPLLKNTLPDPLRTPERNPGGSPIRRKPYHRSCSLLLVC